MNGHHIVLYDINKKKQSFILRPKDEDDVKLVKILYLGSNNELLY